MASTALPDAASTARLTAALRRAGVLDGSEVARAEVAASWPKARNVTLRLRLSYAGAPSTAPASLILKAGRPEEDGGWPRSADREIAFYRHVAPRLPHRVVPRCFASEVATPTQPAWSLLEDLSETHTSASDHPLPPSPATCRRVVRRWADLHAACWGDTRLETLCGISIPESWSNYLRRSAELYPAFMDRFGHLVSPRRRAVCERLIGDAPRVLARRPAGEAFTLVHGDAHWWNCLVPREGTSGEVGLIDWEDWTIGPATTDLAYLMAMLWFPDMRFDLERLMLDAYHEAVEQAGVAGFGREALTDG